MYYFVKDSSKLLIIWSNKSLVTYTLMYYLLYDVAQPFGPRNMNVIS